MAGRMQDMQDPRDVTTDETQSLSARLRLLVSGAVQGVGFRPFVFRLADQMHLGGWVYNSPQGVSLEVEGPRVDLEAFLVRLEREKPPRSFIQSLETTWLDPVGSRKFQIRASHGDGGRTALVLPDIATCPDCLREIHDPADRRYRYPFTNCTHCGPRFSILESLPYDRANTSMKSFTMCAACRTEFDDPRDRRFHAQPNACPACGPRLQLWVSDHSGPTPCDRGPEPATVFPGFDRPETRGFRGLAQGDEALVAAAEALRQGRIVAVKGLGGFQLMTDAGNEASVRQLRDRKHREAKPLALMFPSLQSVRDACEVSDLEARLLQSPEAPIVLLRRTRRHSGIAESVAPGNPNLGAMLPCTPLHHLLLGAVGRPVIATSGNLSDEPICTDPWEAIERLGGIADVFLVHDRPIVRPIDDSVVRVVLGAEQMIRRARGYAPLPLEIRDPLPSGPGPKKEAPSSPPSNASTGSILAVGAHWKNAVALSVGRQVFLSQHIGDLETEQTETAFRRAIRDLEDLFVSRPSRIVADLHPDYRSSRFAEERASADRDAAIGSIRVQHHLAHVLACMADNDLDPPVLGVCWDGTGYGTDGTIWGGEFLRVTEAGVERVAHLRRFRLPGGDAVAREPRRAALGVLHALFGPSAFDQRHLPSIAAFSGSEISLLRTLLAGGIQAPWSSSAGRLFDAVASLIGLRQKSRFEGEAAMGLEFASDGVDGAAPYTLPLVEVETGSPRVLDWFPMVRAILDDLDRGCAPGIISARFHETLAGAIAAVAREMGESHVVLSGGCFQNRRLTERAATRLVESGLKPHWHRRVPPNDGGIALGQIAAALHPCPWLPISCVSQFQAGF